MANEYQGYSNTAWARIAATTLAHHITEVEDNWMRNFQVLSLLESNGRITYNHGGNGFDWPMRWKMHPVEGNTGETARNFTRQNLWKVANLDYRGYQATDAISTREYEANKTPEGIVKIMDGMNTRIEQSIKQSLGTEPWIDGNATGNETSWHGFDSFLSCNGTINISTGAQRTASALDKVGSPDDTYAGVVTTLGNYGGANESGAVWPDGVADVEYDFCTPLVVNATSSAFSPATHTFAGQGDEVLRYGIINSQRNMSPNGQITNIILSRNYYNDFLNLIDNKEQLTITGVPDGLRGLGFKNVVQFDGVEVSWEASVPKTTAATQPTAPLGTGYGFNWSNLELLSMRSTLFVSEGPEYDIDSQFWKAVVSTLSNLKFESIRNIFAVKELA